MAEARDPNEIVDTPANEPDGAILDHDRSPEERAEDVAAAFRAPEAPAPSGVDVRNPFRFRVEKNGDTSTWEQGVVYGPDKKTAESTVKNVILADRADWHVVWVQPMPADEASGLA